MNIDPLAEKYAYNSTYAFQENKMGLGRELEGLELRQDRGMIIATGMSQNDIYTKEPLPSYMAYYNLNAKAPESQGMDAADLPLGAAGMGRWNDADGSFSSFAGEAKATKALGIFEVIKLANTAIDGIEGMKISAENVKAVNYMGKLVDQFKDMTTAQNVVNKADLKLDSKTKTEITNYVFNGALPADIDKRSNSVVNLGSKTNIVNTANSIMRKNDIVVRNSWETKTKQQNEEAARQQQNKLQNIGR
ncbi:hypothetical protein [Epilithonimonas hispanica]|uniref:hypothetical protein n=1 Tax=Epilithonimonas hispanica TaxID=358687 RepID=UPI000F504D7C|nr:hypothetical protein [Epilithonimonas hispanica]